MQGFYYLAAQSTYVDPYDDILSRFVGGGLPTALLGVLTVFTVLCLIWGCLELFKLFFYTIPEKKKKEAAEKTEKIEEPAAPAAVPESGNGDGEIVAAIIAAITAYRAAENAESAKAPSAFRVVSFRRK